MEETMESKMGQEGVESTGWLSGDEVKTEG